LALDKESHRPRGQRQRQRPLVESLGSIHRTPASRDGVAAVPTSEGNSQGSTELSHQLEPRATHSPTPAAATKQLELVDRRTALRGQAPKSRAPRAVDEPAFVAEQALVVAARIDEHLNRIRASHGSSVPTIHERSKAGARTRIPQRRASRTAAIAGVTMTGCQGTFKPGEAYDENRAIARTLSFASCDGVFSQLANVQVTGSCN
jgi:hypothetical protein